MNLKKITDAKKIFFEESGGSEYTKDVIEFFREKGKNDRAEVCERVHEQFEEKKGKINEWCKEKNIDLILEYLNTYGENPELISQEIKYIGGEDITLDYGLTIDAVTGETSIYGDNEEGKNYLKGVVEELKTLWFN